MSAPKLRDVRKLADSRAVFELDIPLAELPGFPVEYQAGGGQVHARLSFGREQGHAMAQVALQADLAATCQRCLGLLQLHVDTHSPVLIVESEQEAEGAPAGWETFLAPEGRLVFAALAAEELLLALPLVPVHAEGEPCRALATEAGTEPAEASHAEAPDVETARPFADLRALLERGSRRE